MNVTIDAMRPSPAPRVLWWITLFFVVAGGLVMRCLTIDRNTPGIGSVVYAVMLVALFIAIACPVGASAACFMHWSRKWVRLAPLRAHAIGLAVVIASLLTIALFGAGRRMPQWHVWMSAAMFTALLTQRVFEATESLLAQTKRDELV